MKKIILLFVFSSFGLMAQSQVDFGKISSENTWIKLGVNTALPIVELGKTQNFGIGLDLGVQFLETKASGIGLKVGYLHYLGKDNNDPIEIIPLAIMYRYYPESHGLFLGLEVGYAFVSGLAGTSGGVFTRPQLGLHYYNWNFFVYYDYILTEESVSDLQAIGLGITYNIRFSKD